MSVGINTDAIYVVNATPPPDAPHLNLNEKGELIVAIVLQHAYLYGNPIF
jgi:hypothetical protein